VNARDLRESMPYLPIRARFRREVAQLFRLRAPTASSATEEKSDHWRAFLAHDQTVNARNLLQHDQNPSTPRRRVLVLLGTSDSAMKVNGSPPANERSPSKAIRRCDYRTAIHPPLRVAGRMSTTPNPHPGIPIDAAILPGEIPTSEVCAEFATRDGPNERLRHGRSLPQSQARSPLRRAISADLIASPNTRTAHIVRSD
jgi:hypothetical protein